MPSRSYPKLELKYCERCGSLWLRSRDSEAVYCARCAEAIAELPPVRGGTPGALQAACGSLSVFFGALLALTDLIGVCA